jgi:hypothetical protein
VRTGSSCWAGLRPGTSVQSRRLRPWSRLSESDWPVERRVAG